MNGSSNESYFDPALLESINRARGITNIFLAITTASSNGLVLVLFATDPYHNIRTSPLSVMVTSLALVDFVVGVALEPVGAFWHLWVAKYNRPPFESKYLQMAEALLLLVSVFHFVVISIERYLAVLNPSHHVGRVGGKLSYVCVVCTWGYSAALIETLQLLGRSFVRNVLYCLHVDIGLFVLGAFFLMAVRQMRIRTKKLAFHSKCQNLAQRLQEREKKVTRTFIRLSSVFVVCCLPWSLLIQTYPLCNSCKKDKTTLMWLFKLLFVLFLANCACNPFLCAWRLSKYRKGLKALYHRCLSKIYFFSTTKFD